MDPLECERSEHHPDTTDPLSINCLQGWFECLAEDGGGCCQDGFSCTHKDCVLISEDATTASPGEDTTTISSTSDSGPPSQSSLYEVGAGDASRRYRKYDQKITKQPGFWNRDKVDGLKTRVLKSSKSDMEVLKAGEAAGCAGPGCSPDLIPESIGGIHQVVQSMVLTLTHEADAVTTNAPLPTDIPGTGGVLTNPVKSSGHSHLKGLSALFARTFSKSHLQYMGLVMAVQLIQLLNH
ncbi:hypothetical protein ABW19_dt0210194 [Dactylella cylindrospora]|nr:hypothetical protein ABW19_dt0210194 [Dactylella cylindrospora]